MINLKPNQNLESEIKNTQFHENQADIGANIRLIFEKSTNFIQNFQNSITKSTFTSHSANLTHHEKQGIFFGYYENEYRINKTHSHFALCPQG